MLFTIISVSSLQASTGMTHIFVDGIEIQLSGASYTQKSSKTKVDSLSIPLKRVGNLFIIEAEINGENGNFILDLGAPYLVLNSTYFRQYNVDSSYYSGSLLNENDYVRRTKVDHFSLESLVFENLSADITDLAEIENKRGIKIYGLLGVSFFDSYFFDLDIREQNLRLYSDKHLEDIKLEKILESPIRIINGVIQLKAQSKGQNLLFSLDTGAERNILSNDLPEEFYQGMQILGTSILTDANGERSEVIISRIGNITVGDRKLSKMPTLILNLDMISRAYGKEIDGMLGYPFFSLGRVMIDFKKKKLGIFQYKRLE